MDVFLTRLSTFASTANFLFYFMDAPDGVSACHMLEIEDEAA